MVALLVAINYIKLYQFGKIQPKFESWKIMDLAPAAFGTEPF